MECWWLVDPTPNLPSPPHHLPVKKIPFFSLSLSSPHAFRLLSLLGWGWAGLGGPHGEVVVVVAAAMAVKRPRHQQLRCVAGRRLLSCFCCCCRLELERERERWRRGKEGSCVLPRAHLRRVGAARRREVGPRRWILIWPWRAAAAAFRRTGGEQSARAGVSFVRFSSSSSSFFSLSVLASSSSSLLLALEFRRRNRGRYGLRILAHAPNLKSQL